MVMTELIFTTATIDAKEGCDITILEQPGAFLHAKNNKMDIMFMKGKLAQLMMHIVPQIYRWYITTHSQGEKFST